LRRREKTAWDPGQAGWFRRTQKSGKEKKGRRVSGELAGKNKRKGQRNREPRPIGSRRMSEVPGE